MGRNVTFLKTSNFFTKRGKYICTKRAYFVQNVSTQNGEHFLQNAQQPKDHRNPELTIFLFVPGKNGHGVYTKRAESYEEFEFDNWKEAEFLISALKNINVFI